MTDAGFYIDSPDTRSYLREIRYKFTIEEEAIWCGSAGASHYEAKFAAWEEIIQTTPDSAVIGRPFGRGERVDSIHQFLRDYMALQKQRLTEFSQPAAGCTPPVLLRENRPVVGFGALFHLLL